MATYEFFFLDGGEHLAWSDRHDCEDDLRALGKAYGLCGKHHVEVWDGERRVCRVNRGSRPSTPHDRVSG